MIPAVRSIVEQEAARAGLFACQITDFSRRAPIARARQIAMWRVRRELGLSFPQIAREFNKRDHTTVMYAVRKIDAEVSAGVGIEVLS